MQYVRLYFEQICQDRRHRKERVDVTLHSGIVLEGRIVAVSAEQFTIRMATSNQETKVNFSDLAKWQPAPPHEHVVLSALELSGLELLRIAILPVTILQAVARSCAC